MTKGLPVLEMRSEISSRCTPGETLERACGSGCVGCASPSPLKPENVAGEADVGEALLDAPEHVLATLDRDGKRRWMNPKLSQGKWWNRRRLLAYFLIVFFVAVPHIRVFGGPLIQLDIVARRFTILGHTFLPTDTLLVALLLLTVFFSILFLTTVMGRAWCGWACPQTVYIEYLFRPIDRLFEGTIGRGGKPKRELGPGLKALRFAIYLVITSVLANTFLAYFVGTEKLGSWLLSSPLDQPAAFLVMFVTTALLTYDFIYFREQTCMIACPYGRFQSVMLDRHSLIVAYDPIRGEPRQKGKRTAESQVGDCLDCNQCVRVCPMGIDIREGLQMECINCTQCIDACDDVMLKAGMQPGLIRYASQDSIEGKPSKLLRARTYLYPILILMLGSGLLYAASTKYGFDARVIRGKGAPFTRVDSEFLSNAFTIRLVNRSDRTQEYEMKITSPSSASIEVVDPDLLTLEKDQSVFVPIRVFFRPELTEGLGTSSVELEIRDASANVRNLSFVLMGPS